MGFANKGALAAIAVLAVGLVIAVAYITFGMSLGKAKAQDASCASVIPTGATPSYGLYLTDGTYVAVGFVHISGPSTPGGFHHNVSITIDQNATTDALPQSYDLGACQPGNTSGTSQFTLAQNGTDVSTLVFTNPTSNGFGITLSSANDSGTPPDELKGTAYLMD
jgi:hypothetical protein